MALKNAFGDLNLEATQQNVLSAVENINSQLRASPLGVEDTYSEFWRIKNKRFSDTEEVRYEIVEAIVADKPVVQNIYTGVAPDGTATSSESWIVIRSYFNAITGSPERERIRFNVAWDDRALGW